MVEGTNSLSCSLNSDKFSVKGERTEESSPSAANSFCCSYILYIWLEDMDVAVGCGTGVGDKAACPFAQHIQLSERMFAVFSAASS